MIARPGLRWAIAACVAWLAMVACNGDSVRFDPPTRVDVPPAAVLATFGDADDAPQVLSRVIAAALSPSGRYLAVADQAPLFVRVLDTTSREIRAFGARGAGPGELRSAYGVEFVDDTTLLVLNGAWRIERFGVDGQWENGFALTEVALMPSALTAACGGRVFVYGVPANHSSLNPVPWVHELQLEDAVSAHVFLTIPGSGYLVGWGALFGFDGTEEGVVLWHGAREPNVGYWLPCDGEAPVVWHHTGTPGEDPNLMARLGGERVGMALTLADTLFAGAAARGSVRIMARSPLRPRDGAPYTTFRAVQGERCMAVEWSGSWTLHDAHALGLIVARSDPFPVVRLVDWTWFERTLTDVACVV